MGEKKHIHVIEPKSKSAIKNKQDAANASLDKMGENLSILRDEIIRMHENLKPRV